jgi:hypothetical protein
MLNVFKKLSCDIFSINFSLDASILDNEDLDSLANGDSRNSKLLLGKYTPPDLVKKFEKRGIIEKLNDQGFKNIRYILDTTDSFVHRLVVTDDLLLHLAFGPRKYSSSFSDFDISTENNRLSPKLSKKTDSLNQNDNYWSFYNIKISSPSRCFLSSPMYLHEILCMQYEKSLDSKGTTAPWRHTSSVVTDRTLFSLSPYFWVFPSFDGIII